MCDYLGGLTESEPSRMGFGTEEIVDKSVDSYKLPEVKLFRIGHDTHPRQYVEKADIKHTPRQGRSTVQNDYQTNHCCSYDRWAIRRHPESNGAQIREVKDLLVILSSNLRSNERLAHETPPRQFNCRVFGTLVLPQFQGRHECTPRTLQIAIRNQPSSEKTLPLSDGVEHTFLQWSASIRDRLVVNDDHYLTDVSRRVLIWGTTTGLAKTYLEPQYLSATHGFRSAEEMMDLLGSYYLTGNETEQARNLFDDLQMGEKGHAAETFPEFKARFQSAASQDKSPSRNGFGTAPEQRIEPATRSRKDVHTYHRYGKIVGADSSHTRSVYPNRVPPQASHTGTCENHSPCALRKLFQVWQAWPFPGQMPP
ncbi:hypothetical protein GMDG_05873 [Pseudogymnoascus destructans 20631-21]|uniref:Uncharacterized protein n=1 Tax=Pseudogymnoascus destructans (strain ATCC MYA-4855 / 20631-21) TaxID=658429 RepID=L8FQ29_PSED2|nr:hypothetical protein GMDG_05873 [Pseudogymnoascus destructans 20631-21]